MNWEPVKNILMVVLGAVGSWIVQKGWVDNATVASVIGAIVTIAGALWAAWKGTAANQIATTSALPSVDGIKVNDAAIAAASPGNVTKT